MKMESLIAGVLRITHRLLTNKSCRVCRVEAQISVGHRMGLGTNLVELVGGAGALVECVPLVTLKLVVEVTCGDALLTIIFLRPQGRVRVTASARIDRSVVYIASRAHRELRHLGVGLRHMRVARQSRRAMCLPSE